MVGFERVTAERQKERNVDYTTFRSFFISFHKSLLAL
jgi:hypothetical protein